ncbi:MAG: hypothetical protein ACFFEF_15560 [Candidatus Thorarchaeota archaeon]
MSLEKIIQQTLDEANNMMRIDVVLQQALRPYIGRYLLVSIDGDAAYELVLSPKGLTMEKIQSRPPNKNEFYISLKRSLAERSLINRKISLSDLRQIKHKNVSARELQLARDLVKKHPKLKSMVGNSK